ncbi:kelch repeat-containing protein 1 [[Candida] anglica]|uniref:Kelch repeat-containing protein 1 n=1 Tax=[Candida] anglica TaxID=148631 RepID=A0ABP0EGL6_9ASCO
MARFKFGSKNKRKSESGGDSTNISVISSEYPNYNNGAYSPSSHAEAPVVPSVPQKDTYGGAPIVVTNATAPGSTQSASNAQFDSILDPKLNQQNDHYTSSAPLDSTPPANTSPWKRHKLFDSPFPRYRHAASSFTSEKGDIYIMGGLKEGSVFGDTWKITPQVDENNNLNFVTKNVQIANNTNPPARVGHSSVLCGNAFIIYGGDTVDTDHNGFPDNNFYLFNINNNKYTVPSHILNKPNGRYGHTIGVIALNNSSSRLYLFGGQLENDVFNDLYYFELNTFKSPKARWETVEPLNNFKPPPLTNHSMCVHKNRIYVFGGVYNNEKVSNDLWCFDAIINKWTQIATTGAVPLPVNEHSSCMVNDKMYIYGGNDFSGVIYDTLYVLDLHSLVWSKLTEQGEINGPGPRCGQSITYLQSYKKLLIMGGDKNDYIDSNSKNFNTYEEFVGDEIVGTMIYELDLLALEGFLSDKPVKSKVSVLPRKLQQQKQKQQQLEQEEIESKQPQQPATLSQPIPKENEDYQVNHGHGRSFSTGPEDFRTPNASPSRKDEGGHSRAAEVAAVAGATAAVTGAAGVASGLGSSHTPAIGSERDFVDFEPSEFTQPLSTSRDINGGGYEEQKNFLPPPSIDEQPRKSPQTFHNGHASFLDNFHEVNSEDDREAATHRSTPTGSRGPSGTGESSEVKKIVTELTTELNRLKTSTREQIQEASTKIEKLERENQTLKDDNQQLKESNLAYTHFDEEVVRYKNEIEERDSIISGLKKDIGGDIDEEGNVLAVPKSISELNQYKLERLELNNKLVYLEQENNQLTEKITKFEPFMNNQITDLSNFQKIIKVQEEKIAKLSNQVRGQEELEKEVLEWKHKFDSLDVEFNNYKTIHEEEEIEVSEDEAEEVNSEGGVGSSGRSIISSATGRRSKRDISSHLENLVNLWSNNGRVPPVAVGGVGAGAGESKEISENGTPATIDPIVGKLQNQVNELLTISKEQQAGSASEINELRSELTAKLQSLKTFENNYRDALQSVNNTSRALDTTHEELAKQKELSKKLIKENEELKLYQKASKRASVRNTTPISTIEEGEQGVTKNVEGIEEEDHNDITSAHFNMKLQDLQADLFIMKQERDQLKDDVTTLKKQLYLSQNK